MLPNLCQACALYLFLTGTIHNIFQILFRKYGWNKSLFISPRYRFLTQKNNFDDYASKGSSVHPVKKYHRALATGTLAIEDSRNIEGTAVVAADGESTGECQWYSDEV